jgi:uncharacterized phage protein (TIGR02218 family)
MKRLMPSSLITFLQANPNCVRAHLYSIALPNGSSLLATDGSFDLTIPAGTPGWLGSTTTFSASLWGRWSRGAITSEAAFSFNSNTMDLTCVPQQGTAFPGSPMGILAAARNGLFDACEVYVYAVYMPLGQYGNVSAGVETKFRGQITDIQDIARTSVKFQCADYCYLLNIKVPSRIIQTNCPWSFADANCGLSPASYTTTFTAATGSTGWTLTPTVAFTETSGYYTQGVVKCITGSNNGLSQCIKLHDATGNLEMICPWLLPVAAGDTFTVIAGCDKSVTTCTQKFKNLGRFGGMPFVPVPATAA